MASHVSAHHNFLAREFQAPMGAYSGEYGTTNYTYVKYSVNFMSWLNLRLALHHTT